MMEFFWYILASVLAGVGTGLVGLSAATVMVPILIVLCPSFAGETGAYQATAIALASDILGSAVTTATYIKHKNIDLRRGWIMLVCIIGMCTLGSFAAWKAGNVVLGGFTLILTFCIGIRFLVKPSTERADAEAKGAKLAWKGIAVSLFFGLTIGFGTGFVGSGGGMMMLVVFTAFLGMELKTAVGTSTFIMTFTALIASVSHIFIHPAILLERWPVLLLCMAAATAASLVSARFANRVDNRTVGRVTGVVLTVLGAALILLHYWELIAAQPLAVSVLRCFGEYLLFIIPAALILLVLHFTLDIPRVVFRKLLHLPAFCSAAVIVWRADCWQTASLTLVLFAVIVYPVLWLCQGWSGYDRLFVQKKPGEIKKSLLLLFLCDAALVALCWGAFDLPWAAVAAILMWGSGDGAAALAGHRFGKHHVKLPLADPQKTWEGSGAMLTVSTVVGTAAMLILTAEPWYRCLMIALAASIFGAYTELISRGGDDTVTVPVVNTVVLLILHFLLR
ncbi:MAG: TSUP family transporter [Clostridiales bacterium]|nr:TSUP family transporter [Clostridiales bacterium]